MNTRQKRNGTRWQIVSVEIDSLGSKLPVRGFVTSRVPGLAVTEGIENLAGQWCITHRLSGFKLGWGHSNVLDALEKMERLGKLVDWTLPGDAIRKKRVAVKRIAAIIAGGLPTQHEDAT